METQECKHVHSRVSMTLLCKLFYLIHVIINYTLYLVSTVAPKDKPGRRVVTHFGDRRRDKSPSITQIYSL